MNELLIGRRSADFVSVWLFGPLGTQPSSNPEVNAGREFDFLRPAARENRENVNALLLDS